MRADVRGLEDLQGRLAALEDLDVPSVDQAAAQLVARAARPPVLTGALAASLTALDGHVVALAGHGAPVHWGTKYMPARPFVLDAAAVRADQVTDLYAKAVDEALS